MKGGGGEGGRGRERERETDRQKVQFSPLTDWAMGGGGEEQER